ncbi:acyl carrier protein [Paenibacillus sp. HB172176]|uniref:acyl carrier protein n=1 Tax=Paenibacillus sp. HB172176 TaxID=2493690 RepID=UPI00143A02FE|nr:acyl carrier protein [Paenibacillus sp. HB172176]
MERKITEIIAELKEDPSLANELTAASSITEDAGLDSLQLVNFILRIEDEFGVEFDFDEFDLEHLRSIEAFCAFVAERE